MRKNRFLALAVSAVVSAVLAVPAHSQTRITDSLVFSGSFYKAFFPSGSVSFTPDTATDLLNIVKLGASYELPFPVFGLDGKASLGLETGYSSGSMFGGWGSVDFIPLLLNATYAIPVGSYFTVGPNLKLGGFAALGSGESAMAAVIGGRVEGEFSHPSLPVTFYGAAGADVFPTLDNGALPVIEIGVRYRPGRGWARSDKNAAAQGQSNAGTSQAAAQGRPNAGTSPGATPGQPNVGTSPGAAQGQPNAGTSPGAVPSQARDTPFDSPGWAPGGPIRGEYIDVDGVRGYLRAIYFEPDTADLIETSRPSLDAVGRDMAAYPSFRLLLRAYTAPAKTPEGRIMVSGWRANFARDYLVEHDGVAAGRITGDLFGSLRTPQWATREWESLRCVELIILER
jgi:outer membrane protein OmpA-like peptidoglycan-associated protein